MFKRLFGSKVLVLFLIMALIGFFIGYDYALITTKQNKAESINAGNNNENTTTKYSDTIQDLEDESTSAEDVPDSEEE